MHYTDQPSRLEAHKDLSNGVMLFEGGGIVTEAMVDQAFSRVKNAPTTPPHVLIDLRNVAGYDANAVTRAEHLLAGVVAAGVRRIAFVADSPLLHTTAQVLSSGTSAAVRGFHHEPTARAWLQRRAP